MLDFLSQPVFQRLALTLLHFLWQGAAVAVVLGIGLWRLDRGRPRARYAACMVALAAIVALPVVTFLLVQPAERPAAGDIDLDSVQPTSDSRIGSVPHHDVRPAPTGDVVERPAIESVNPPDSRRETQSPIPFVSEATPYLVSAWMLGVLVFGLRLLCGFVGMRRLLRDRVELPDELLEVVRELGHTMRLAASPLVCGSRRVAEAMAVGFLRPVVLLPVAWLAEVPPDVLRSVLAHELAHVRRWDRWVNLLQRVVEAVLFYHPAVWWVSRRMRAEREFCCDDEAARAVGGAVRYAEALEHIGRLHCNQRQLLLRGTDCQSVLLTNPIGGTKMALLKRVRRVLGMSETKIGRDAWAVGLLAVCIPLMLLVASTWWPSGNSSISAAVADDGDKDREKAERPDRERPREAEQRERKREERKEAVERRERDQPERKAADRPVPERREGAERRKRDVPREGERRERGERREGDRPREVERRRDAERRREVERKERPQGAREPGRRDRGPGDVRRREGDRPQPANLRELLQIIRELQTEVRQLRREVQELKGRRGDRPRGERDRGRRAIPRRDGDRPRVDRPDNIPRRRDGEKRREGDRGRPAN